MSNPRFGFELGASGFFCFGTPMHEYPRASFWVIFNRRKEFMVVLIVLNQATVWVLVSKNPSFSDLTNQKPEMLLVAS